MDAPLAVLNAAPVQGCRGSVFNFKNNGWSCSKFHFCTLHWWILALYITSLCRFLWWNLNCDNCVVFFVVDGVWHGVDYLLMVLVKFLATSCNIYITEHLHQTHCHIDIIFCRCCCGRIWVAWAVLRGWCGSGYTDCLCRPFWDTGKWNRAPSCTCLQKCVLEGL